MRKVRGSITIYLATIWFMVLILIITLIESARIHGTNAYIECATVGSMNCLLGNYDTDLADQYNLLLYDGNSESGGINTQAIIDEIYQYMEQYQKTQKGNHCYPFTIEEIELTNLETVIDNNASGFTETICDEMKYQELLQLFSNMDQILSVMGESATRFGEITKGFSNETAAKGLPIKELSTKELSTKELSTKELSTKELSTRELSTKANDIKDDGIDYIWDDYPGQAIGSENWVTLTSLMVYPTFWDLPSKQFVMDHRPSRFSVSQRNLETVEQMAYIMSSQGDSLPEEKLKQYMVIQFVANHCSCFTDVDLSKQPKASENGNVAPGFEMEYIFAEKETDYDNFCMTVMFIVMLRTVMNSVHILKDQEKMELVTETAQEIFAATQSPAAIEMGKYMIIYLWAYAESIYDAQLLVREKEAVALLKNKDDWHTDIEGIAKACAGGVSVAFHTLLEKILSDKKNDTSKTALTDGEAAAESLNQIENAAGLSQLSDIAGAIDSPKLDYKEYLMLLLMMKDIGSLSYITMDILQWQCQEKREGFLMENLIYGFEISVTAKNVPVLINKLWGTELVFDTIYQPIRFPDQRHY